MMSLPRALALSFSQLGDPAIVRVLVKSLLITLGIFIVTGVGLWFVLDALIETWVAANLPDDYSDTVAGFVALVLGLVGAWLLFRFVALFVLQFFADEVVRAVEMKYYPRQAGLARSFAFREELANGVRSTMRALLVNLLALPFAIMLLVGDML